jgi:hypothetical protein
MGQDDIGLGPFNITLLDSKCEVYTLCPVVPREMIVTTEIYQQMEEYLSEASSSDL